MKRVQFPNNKRFVFTILDDTDLATLENIKPVYDLLLQLNIITTKSVWVFPTTDIQNPYYHSQTLADSKYLEFIKWLNKNGFEIAFHNASMSSCQRDVTISALECFKELLGFYPKVHVNHHENKENLYWGYERIDLPILKVLMKMKKYLLDYEGHKTDSSYFWGDICLKHITYVRSFVFREINLLRINPTIPYKDPNRPFVKYWFSSSEGGTVRSFNELLSFENQDKLEREGGVCIVYTHFANGFVENKKVNPLTKELLIGLSKRNGWFVPVSTLLDYLKTQQHKKLLSKYERMKMEFKWFLTKVFYGTS